jgi:hypothetical protein
MMKTKSEESLRVLLRLLIDEFVEDLSRTAWQTRPHRRQQRTQTVKA